MARGNRLKEVREKEGLSQSQLANLSGVSERTISRVERGARSVSPLTRARILKALNKYEGKTREYDIDDLFPETALPRRR